VALARGLPHDRRNLLPGHPPGELEAFRSFSLEKDLWIADHRPFKFIKHPLVSPPWFWRHSWKRPDPVSHLQLRGVRQVRFMDMINVLPVPRPSRDLLREPAPVFGRCCARSLWHTGDLPHREIDRPLHPALQGPSDPDGGGELSRGGAPDFPVPAGRLRDEAHESQKRCLNGTKTAAASKAGSRDGGS